MRMADGLPWFCPQCGEPCEDATGLHPACVVPFNISAKNDRPDTDDNSGRRIGRVTVRKTPHLREWVAVAWDTNGERFPDADCYESSREDAEATARAMMRDAG